MFPFLFISVWKIIHGVKQEERNKMKEQRKKKQEKKSAITNAANIQENQTSPVSIKKKRPNLHYERKHKAFGILFFSLLGLVLIPLLGIGVKLVVEYLYTIEHKEKLTWHPYTANYSDILRIRKENMKRYSFQYSRSTVDKRTRLSLREFEDVYDGKWPVVIKDVVPKWAAFQWSKEFLTKYYGKDRISMKAVHGKLHNAESLALPLELFAQHSHEGSPGTWTYLEDELFIPMRPQLKRDIGQVVYLLENYFDIFPQEIRPWDAMLLWGTAYSRSAMHIDPYNWTGTNAVLKGKKRWKLYPPVQDQHMYVFGNRRSNFPLDCYKYNSPVDAFDEESFSRFPAFKNTVPLEFDQLPGELLIIPTGWFHQAYNVEETIAISGQAMNNNNYKIVLEEIFKAGNLPRKCLPGNFYSLSPKDQVKVVMQQIPKSVINRGRDVSRDILNQVNKVPNKK